MKRVLPILILLLLAASGGSLLAAGNPGPEPLPADQFQLDQYAGKVVFLDFWASWCKPCQKSLPWLVEMQTRYGGEGLVVVAVNLDQKLSDAASMIACLSPGVVLVHDPEGKLAQQYELEGMPSAFVYARDGRLAARHLGFQSKDAEERENQLKKLLQEETKNEG